MDFKARDESEIQSRDTSCKSGINDRLETGAGTLNPLRICHSEVVFRTRAIQQAELDIYNVSGDLHTNPGMFSKFGGIWLFESYFLIILHCASF